MIANLGKVSMAHISFCTCRHVCSQRVFVQTLDAVFVRAVWRTLACIIPTVYIITSVDIISLLSQFKFQLYVSKALPRWGLQVVRLVFLQEKNKFILYLHTENQHPNSSYNSCKHFSISILFFFVWSYVVWTVIRWAASVCQVVVGHVRPQWNLHNAYTKSLYMDSANW